MLKLKPLSLCKFRHPESWLGLVEVNILRREYVNQRRSRCTLEFSRDGRERDGSKTPQRGIFPQRLRWGRQPASDFTLCLFTLRFRKCTRGSKVLENLHSALAPPLLRSACLLRVSVSQNGSLEHKIMSERESSGGV